MIGTHQLYPQVWFLWACHVHLRGVQFDVITDVIISRGAQRQLRKLPQRIVDKLRLWVEAVENDGLEVVRRSPGYHDEPLKGARKGQRSIRLSRQYRAIYRIRKDDEIEFVSVEEVTPHDY